MTSTALTVKAPGRFLVATYTLTLITSAALLFWLQPMIAKFILPRVGGAPQVWNTAMMFFQAALLLGYLYAHLLSKRLSTRGQVLIHISLLLICLMWLPVGIDPTSVPPSDGNPSWWVLSALALSIGIPFVIISGSAPLLQTWFSMSGHKDAENPYFLYAASNVGSMSALFAFPLVAEPLLDLHGQSLAWSVSFGALVLLSTLSGAMALMGSPADATPMHHPHAAADISAPTALHKLLWTALMMASTSLMLGITTLLTSDVAAVPLLWVVPLALYLLTFVIVFARRPIIGTERILHWLLAALVLFAVMWVFGNLSSSWLLLALTMLVVYFITVLACHGELARLKPHKAWLTEFYLWMALGGVLGGAFNSLLAPLLFRGATEFAQMMGVGVALILAARAVSRQERPRAMLALALACVVFPLVAEQAGWLLPKNILARERNFFGVLSIMENPQGTVRMLSYGTTVHGMRNLTPGQELEPVGYYGRTSPLGDVMTDLAQRPRHGDVAVIGLGVGSISCYPTQGRTITFFEINNAVTRVAEQPGLFDFLKGCGSDYSVVHGDGRLGIQAVPAASYDLIFLDAFSSDSIPVHLLTREAFQIYIDKLAPGGMVLAHISNKHLDLSPVLASIANDLGLVALKRQSAGNKDTPMINAPAIMVAVARAPKDLGTLPSQPGWHALHADPNKRTWTDSYSNILGALRILKDW